MTNDEQMKTVKFIGAATICLVLENINFVAFTKVSDRILFSMSKGNATPVFTTILSVADIENDVADFQTMAYDFARKCAAQLALAEQPVSAAVQ